MGHSKVLGVVAIILLIFIASPVFIVVPLAFSDSTGLRFPPESYSFERFGLFFESGDWLAAAFTSARVAVLAVLIALPLGTGMALGMVRGVFPGKRLLNSLIIAPLVLPTLIYGLALLFLFRRVGIYDTYLGLVLAYVVIALPFIVIICRGAVSLVR